MFSKLPELSSSSGLIRYTELQLGKTLGSGSFGVVRKGIYNKTIVAVKQPNGELSPTQLNELMKEAILMQSVSPHVNVLKFVGICVNPIAIGMNFDNSTTIFLS